MCPDVHFFILGLVSMFGEVILLGRLWFGSVLWHVKIQ